MLNITSERWLESHLFTEEVGSLWLYLFGQIWRTKPIVIIDFWSWWQRDLGDNSNVTFGTKGHDEGRNLLVSFLWYVRIRTLYVLSSHQLKGTSWGVSELTLNQSWSALSPKTDGLVEGREVEVVQVWTCHQTSERSKRVRVRETVSVIKWLFKVLNKDRIVVVKPLMFTCVSQYIKDSFRGYLCVKDFHSKAT